MPCVLSGDCQIRSKFSDRVKSLPSSIPGEPPDRKKTQILA